MYSGQYGEHPVSDGKACVYLSIKYVIGSFLNITCLLAVSQCLHVKEVALRVCPVFVMTQSMKTFVIIMEVS